MADSKEFDVTVLYCSDSSIKGNIDKEFGKKVQWDVPMLDGYKSIFLKNYSWKPSVNNSFWGLINVGVLKYVSQQKKQVLVIHGWNSITNIAAIVTGKIVGHTVCLRAETPLNQELQKNKVITFCKHTYLRCLFLFVDYFLYIGKQNKLFYQSLGVKEPKLQFAPYSVDNARFQEVYKTVSKKEARQKLGLLCEKKIILYSGKYISKKNPLHLLKAFSLLNDKNSYLVMVGEGELRSEMEVFVHENKLSQSVVLTGFINQSLIPLYYAAADVFVMCSGLGETWGLSVNEAMNFNLPCIVSDTCGCADDLIMDGVNGFVFKTGDMNDLQNKIQQCLQMNNHQLNIVMQINNEQMQRYSNGTIINTLKLIGN